MAKVTNLNDYRRQREKQRRAEERKKGIRRFFATMTGRLFLVILLAVGAFLFFQYADQAEIQTYISENITGSNRGLGFPVTLSSKNAKGLETLSGAPLALTETNLQAYSTSGRLLRDAQHGYKSPTLKVRGKYYLLYDRGSVGFQMGTRSSVSFEKKSTETILSGAVSSGGKVGIATARDSFGSSLTVYGRGGEVAFGWYTTEGYITCLDLDESRGLVGTISTDAQGAYQSTIYYFNFRSSDPIFKLDLPGEMVYSCVLSGNSLEVVTGQNYYRFSREGQVEQQFPYGGMKLVSFAMGESCTALVLADSLGDYRQELCVFRSPEEPTRSAYEVRQVSKLKVSGDRVLLMEGGMVLALDGNTGELLSSVAIDESDRDMALHGNSLYILSSSSISQHDLGERVEESYGSQKPDRKTGNFWDDTVNFFRSLFFVEEKPANPQKDQSKDPVEPSTPTLQQPTTPENTTPGPDSPADGAPPEEDTPPENTPEDSTEGSAPEDPPPASSDDAPIPPLESSPQEEPSDDVPTEEPLDEPIDEPIDEPLEEPL